MEYETYLFAYDSCFYGIILLSDLSYNHIIGVHNNIGKTDLMTM